MALVEDVVIPGLAALKHGECACTDWQVDAKTYFVMEHHFYSIHRKLSTRKLSALKFKLRNFMHVCGVIL